MTRILDLHAHPSLKMYYLPYLRDTFHAAVYAGNHWNPLSFRTQYHNLKSSPIKIMLNAHYVIEKGFVAQGIKAPARALSWMLAPLFYGKLRTADPWKTLMGMMDTLENSITKTNRWVLPGKKKFKLIRRYSEIADLQDNEMAFIHAIEGSHALGYGPEKDESLEQFWAKTERRLKYLKERGVCMITLAHFWDNVFAPQTDGTEVITKEVSGKVLPTYDDVLVHMRRAEWSFDDRNRLAERFARKLFELGIVIDLAHVQPHARQRIYELAEEYNRPIIASHNGLTHFFDHEYNLTDAEIKRFHKLGGVIGLILSRRWLVDPIKRHKADTPGIPDLVENMVYIRDLVGDVSCIGLGTDFDGLTHPFKDCYKPSQLHRIAEAMSKHFSEDEIDQILYRNSLRALERGWTEQR